MNPFMDNIAAIPNGITTMWYTAENPGGVKGGAGKANHGRKGAPAAHLAPRQTLTLMSEGGSGTVRRIWIVPTMNPAHLRGIRIEIFWDGAATPAVNAPLGDFFCQNGGRSVAFESGLFASPEGRSLVCFIPMPFRRGALIRLVNETNEPNCIYYEIDATLGDDNTDNLYFHAYWRRENPTRLRRDFTILPNVKGRGRFIGTSILSRIDEKMNNFWWGEGEVKAYIDDDGEYPSLCGTGTEDYIATGYGQGKFETLWSGNIIAEQDRLYSYYRFHIPDPVYFYRNIRVTIQNMGGPTYRQMLDAMRRTPGLRFMKAGDGTQWFTEEELEAHPDWATPMERYDDYSATAYWYMDRPENGLGPIQPLSERTAELI